MKLLSPSISWWDNRGNYVDDNDDASISNEGTSIYKGCSSET
jgi:hypothetical protein